ncbi:MAG: patatin-like phospholipase family protein [Neisseriaceae bacterium]|nr:patatin-like phospholipase family protein [Neisseriaceae bacterium]
MKTGLVLSGGGAKGAYQVGVMKALLEKNVAIDCISGASIGALNGCILASAPDLKTGVERLEEVWGRLPEIKPLQAQSMGRFVPALLPYLSLLASSGLRLNPYWKAATMLAAQLFKDQLPETPDGILTDTPLRDLMNEYLDLKQLQQSIPLFVSVFEQQDFIKESMDYVGVGLLGKDNKPSRFVHIQSLPINEQKEMILASAAIPLIFQSKKDADNNRLTDGGQGGALKSQGNTPITPLIEQEHCDFVIVSHLSQGTLWNRHDFRQTACIEIRPNAALDLGVKAVFDFSAEKIQQLQQAGYEDTLLVLGDIQESLSVLYQKREVNQQLARAMANNDSQQKMQDAMRRLQSKK